MPPLLLRYLSVFPPKFKVSFELAYVVFGASWIPSYDARVNSGADVVEICYYGNITNSCGEDWEDVFFWCQVLILGRLISFYCTTLGSRSELSGLTLTIIGKPPTLYGITVDFKNSFDMLPPVARPLRNEAVRNFAPSMVQRQVQTAMFGTLYELPCLSCRNQLRA